MKRLFRSPLCWLRGAWYTIKTSNVYDFTPVSGHSWVQSAHDKLTFECECCGKSKTLF